MVIIENMNKTEFENIDATLQDIASFRVFLRNNIYTAEVINELSKRIQTSFSGNVYQHGLCIYIDITPPAGAIPNVVTIDNDIYRIIIGVITHDLLQTILFTINNSNLTKTQKNIYKNILYKLTNNPFCYQYALCGISTFENTVAVSL